MHTEDRLHLAQLPTPLDHADRLSEAWGADIWIKRDDLTGFELSGNKVRKLEYHLKAAQDAGATTVITCGAAQSNHSRATALAAARLGMHTILYLRTPDGKGPEQVWGNHLLQRLAGAECRFITPAEYDERNSIMEAAALDIENAWVIPEGASDALGSMGFVNAAHELAGQVEGFQGHFTLWHASMSAGTTAGLVLGAKEVSLDVDIVGCAVGDSAEGIAERVRSIVGSRAPDVRWSINDSHIGGGYGVISDEEMKVQAEATRLTGLLFDPTYTGKAIYGLHQEIANGTFGPDDTVVFWHTGGGFATFAYDWSRFV
ncbi:MAG: pyridoxal-phosphate dependent enzyme [Actinomycetia bacterium]|nr:pyridoxal-phosphate dependent enzyme [Actinomycetes bacterium]